MSGVEAVRGARRISHHNNCFDVWNVVNRNSKSRSPKQQTTCVWIMIHDHELMWHHPIRQVHPSSHQAFILRSPVPHSHLSLRPLEHRSDHNEIEMETSWLRSKPPEWCDKNQRPDIFDVRSFSFCRDMLWIHKERLWISLHIYIYILSWEFGWDMKLFMSYYEIFVGIFPKLQSSHVSLLGSRAQKMSNQTCGTSNSSWFAQWLRLFWSNKYPFVNSFSYRIYWRIGFHHFPPFSWLLNLKISSFPNSRWRL